MNVVPSQHMCNQTWKTEGRSEQFVAARDYYDCPFSVLLRDIGEAAVFQNKQTRKHENKALQGSASVEGTQRKSPERAIKRR